MKQIKTEQLQEQNIKEEVQRWDIVALGTLIMSGNYYCMQEIPTIHDFLNVYFTQQGFDHYKYDQYINMSQSCALGLLIFYASFIGVLSDKLKPGVIIILQTLLLVLGQFMVYISVHSQNFWFLFFGRMILFTQCATMFVSVKVLVNNFTSQSQKGLSLGITVVSVIFFGINLLLEPYLVQKLGLSTSTFITFLVASVTFGFSVFSFHIEQKLLQQEQQAQFEIIMMNETTDQEGQGKQQMSQQEVEQELSYLDQMKSLSLCYWIYCPITFLNIIVSSITENNGPAIISQEWKYDTNLSTQINSIGYFMGIFLPLLGYLVDKLNRDYELVIIASILKLIGVIILGFYSPLIGFIILGIGFNLRIAVFSPLLTKIVPKNSLGKAYGLIRSLKDFIGMIIFFFISINLDKTQSFQDVLWLLVLICTFILFLSIYLYFIGKKKQI